MPITGGDWLFAIHIASRGLKLDDEAVRVAVGLRLGRALCEQHRCHYGSVVCKRDPGPVSEEPCPERLGRLMNTLNLFGWNVCLLSVTLVNFN